MAAPLITAITTVPNRENATNQASFSNDVDTFFSQVDGFQTQANAQAQYLDGVAAGVDAAAAAATEDINAAAAAATTGIDASEAAAAASALEASGYASTAVDARDAAIASAVYKGTWEGKTSAGVIGESYSYQGSYIYRLNVNLANVSTSVPSPTNTDWQLINVVPFEAPCKPTLDLDFANQDFTIYDKLGGFVKRPLADIVTQGRATAGTSTDAIGGVTEFGAGENRFTFDGDTGEALGYLSEESRTNLVVGSESWNYFASNDGTSTVSESTVSNPINAESVSLVTVTSDPTRTGFYQYRVSTPSVIGLNVFSFYIKPSETIVSFGSQTSAGNNKYFRYDVSSGSITGANAENTIVKPLTDGWYRCSITFSSDSSTTLQLIVANTSDAGTGYFFTTGYQSEAGSFPTSYIRTLGAPVNRASDSMTRTLGQEWNPNEGTFVVDVSELLGSSSPKLFSVSILGDLNNRLFIGKSGNANGSANYITQITIGGVNTIIDGYPTGNARKIALTYENGLISVSADGEPANSRVIGNLPPFNTLLIGRNTIGSGFATCKYKHFQYYPRAFDPLTLQRLSRIQ